MKKIFALVLCAALMLSGTAFAYSQDDLTGRAVANGVVMAAEFVDVVAPYSGTLKAFDLNAGDVVEEGENLFEMMTTAVYATEDGVVTWVFAGEGDSADAAMARYGAVISMEPAQGMRIVSSTKQAYNDEENKQVHVGEILYFRSAKGDKEEGAGRVIMVNGEDYVVDILTGEFELGEALTLYRDDDYANKDSVGKGSVIRRDPISVFGSGVIGEMCVEAGQSVEKGEVLMRLMTADADMGAKPAVDAPVNGVIAAVAVASGQQVWKGQMLARVYVQDGKEIVAEVDEVFVQNIKVGDEVPVVLDTDEDTILTGTVTEISALGNMMANASYYTVHVRVPYADGLMLGQSAKIYLPR